MKSSSLFFLAAAGCGQLVAAHSTVWNILVNGVDQGVGNQQGGYIDTPPNNSPVKDVTSTDLECNVANIKAARSITVNGGDAITFEWHHNDNSAGDDIIATSHLGPIMVYISKNNLPGGSWTKLWQDGWDGTSQDASSWAVTKLINGKYTGKPGQHSMTLPKLAPGDYVLRPEILALHEGFSIGGAQFYMECVHVKVTGSGTLALPQGVSFPGAYKATDPGIYFNLYNGYSSYTIPGPAVWVPGSSSPASSSSPSSPASSPAASSAAASSLAQQPSTPASNPSPSSSPAAAAPSSNAPATTLQTSASPPPSTPSTGSSSCVCPGGPVPQWSQCGGRGYTGATGCAYPNNCVYVNDYYSQCQATSPAPYCDCASGTVARYNQCGGKGYSGATGCITPWRCTYVNDYYSQCL